VHKILVSEGRLKNPVEIRGVVLTDEEKTSRFTTILADAALEAAVDELKIFKEHSLVDIKFYEVLSLISRII
jgi:hypothetical protein